MKNPVAVICVDHDKLSHANQNCDCKIVNHFWPIPSFSIVLWPCHRSTALTPLANQPPAPLHALAAVAGTLRGSVAFVVVAAFGLAVAAARETPTVVTVAITIPVAVRVNAAGVVVSNLSVRLRAPVANATRLALLAAAAGLTS